MRVLDQSEMKLVSGGSDTNDNYNASDYQVAQLGRALIQTFGVTPLNSNEPQMLAIQKEDERNDLIAQDVAAMFQVTV